MPESATEAAGCSTHWLLRNLPAEVGVSKENVHCTTAHAVGPQPHRFEHYVVSNDPEFETKAADIIALHLETTAARHAVLR